MVHLITSYFTKRYVPRSIVLMFDLVVVLFTFLLAYILRFNFDLNQVDAAVKFNQVFWILPVYIFSFWLFKSYSGIIRHSTTLDITRIIFSLTTGGLILAFASFLLRMNNKQAFQILPYSVIIIHFTLSSLLLITSRLLVKTIFNEWLSVGGEIKNVMIFGAGQLGQITRNALKMDKSSKIKLVGFIDDNVFLQKKRAAGVQIYSASEAFDKIIEKKNVKEIIFAIEKQNLPLARKRQIIDLCIPKNLIVKEIPSVNKWINGELKTSKIKKIKIEDLLGRDAIALDRGKIEAGVKDAVILISGAAGSIGSEIVRQLISFNAYHVILLDKAESDLYNLQNEIHSKYKNPNFTIIVGDVTNSVKIRRIFEKYSPDIVINAAAYKHVPLMEEYPCEAIRVNIGGTRTLANLSVEFGVKKFVQVSTDKAVNPTNVMGASKRISEIYIQALSQKTKVGTQFITTRFGNVLGSNGSVVPLFRKQIENGGPITVTHYDITRFFMTIPEACQLVLEASFMGKGGEIFVFDMGQPVKIYDLAEKMIFLSGFIPHVDIKIEITNLRPGEKLYEELLSSQEGTLPTYNEKIMIGKNEKYDYETVNRQIVHLLECVDHCENQQLVDIMREIVPEFVSKNSQYTNQSPREEGTLAAV